MEPFMTIEVTSRDEFDALIDVVWKAHYNPYDPAFSAFFPIFGPTAADREAAIQESKDRLWQSHQCDSSSHWIYIRHLITGEVVGGTQWLIYRTNPYANGAPKMEASWWPEGSAGRMYCNELLRLCHAPKHQWMNRPHLALNRPSVHPKYRHRGIGEMLIYWGVDKAKELGIESFIEASASGKDLYERFGYHVLFKISFHASKKDTSDEWRKLEHELGPVVYFAMWRPATGVFEDGKTVLPWDISTNVLC